MQWHIYRNGLKHVWPTILYFNNISFIWIGDIKFTKYYNKQNCMFIGIHTFLFSIAHCPFEELIEQIYDTLMETNIVNEKVVVGILWYYFGRSAGGRIMVGICTNIICLKEKIFRLFLERYLAKCPCIIKIENKNLNHINYIKIELM